MKVTLINFTPYAVETLIFAKSTRLNMTPDLMSSIMQMSDEDKMKEIEYIANTIPSSHEFVDYMFLIERVSRAFTHQLVRTRHGSYAQQTMRMIDKSTYDYVHTEKNDGDPDALDLLKTHQVLTQDIYRQLIDAGQPVEDARGVLPTNIATNIVAKFNLRTLSELCKSRTGGRTQGEYQAVVGAMADAVLSNHPWADKFLYPHGRDHFNEIEEFAKREFGNDVAKKNELLKIVDHLRKK